MNPERDANRIVRSWLEATVSFGDFQEVPELEDKFSIALQCSRMFDASTWILGGEIDESTHVGTEVGTRSAFIVRDGSAQQVVFWFEDSPPAADCLTFVNAISDEDLVNAGFMPVEEGEDHAAGKPGRLGGHCSEPVPVS